MAVRYISWKPEGDTARDEVRKALGDVLESAHFRNSRRYPMLLSYLVEETLAGRTDEIKERTLGVEVFGRPVDYDTNTDTAVRYTAGEIRKRLALYYHTHPDATVQIALTTRSYVPEFLHADEAQAEEPAPADAPARAVPSASSGAGTHWRTLALCLVAILGIAVIAAVGVPLWRMLQPDPVRAFWAPFVQPGRTALICPGGNVFDPLIEGNARPADERNPAPYLSFGNGIAMSRVAADIRSQGGDYIIQAAGATALSHLSEHPSILIGAYNNPWTERLLHPFRFHFSPAEQKGIVDAQNPGALLSRSDENVENSADYAIVARFRSASTGNTVVVVAGLKRFGTDAASRFLSSAEDLKQLDARLGKNWTSRNIEVVLKVDVAAARVGAPQIVAATVW